MTVFVFEAAGKTECTGLCSRPKRSFISVTLRASMVGTGFPHHLLRRGCVTYHAGEIDGGGSPFQMSEEIRKREIRFAILADKYCCNALAGYAFGVEVLENSAVVVAVHVDEAGSECQPMLVANGLAGLRRQMFSDGRDPVALHADVLLGRFLSTAVIDEDVFDEDVRCKTDSGNEDEYKAGKQLANSHDGPGLVGVRRKAKYIAGH